MAEPNLFATFPISGVYPLPIGDNHFDFIKGIVTTSNGTVIPMAKRTAEDRPLEYLWLDCDNDSDVEVRYLGDVQYIGRVSSGGFYFQDMTYDDIIITVPVLTNIHVIGSSSKIAGIGNTGGGGGGGTYTGGDVVPVESDIDGNNAQTVNSLMYGRESPGVTHPLRVDLNGDLITSGGVPSMVYGELLPTPPCAAGSSIQFDIAPFVDLATLKQIGITQLTTGNCNYTLEIWERDASGYTPGTYTDHYLKIFSRDVDKREWRENIDGGLLYRDRDASAELHCRLINGPLGTTSLFNVSVVGIEG